MKRTVLVLMLAIGGLLASASVADAQVIVPRRTPTFFNPWLAPPNYSVGFYNPFTGIYSTESRMVSPWTGTTVVQAGFVNPNTGWQRTYSSGFDPWTNQYQFNYSYHNPRATWRGGYWR